MKTLVAAFVLWGCQRPAPPAADLPRPAADGGAETVIRVRYPAGGHRMSVRGDGGPLSWDRGLPMTALGADTFEYRVTGLGAPLHFKPLLDDQVWSRGTNYQVAPGATAEVYPHFLSAQGTRSRYWPVFPQGGPSKFLGNQRGVWIYLPPSFHENPLATYPVLYMHDGQNLFDPKASFAGVTWQVAPTLDAGADALDPQQHIPEVIVIAPENAGAQRLYEYTPTAGGMGGGGGDLYLRFLVEELKPAVEKEFGARARPDGAQTALVGSSLGGLISAYAGLRDPTVFSRIGVMSPSTWWDNRYIIGQVMAIAPGPRALRVYVDSGDSGDTGPGEPNGDDYLDTQDLAAAYRAVGYRDGVDLLYVLQHGGMHNEAYWAQRLPGALHFLLGDL